MENHLPQRVRVERRAVTEDESRRANGPDWDRYADEYQATHGEFLGDVGFVWGPEGLTEARARVLGDVADRDVLEVGSGAGQCSRWVRAQGYSEDAIDGYLDDKDEKHKIYAMAERYLAANGAKKDDVAGFCALGRKEIAANSIAGSLLYEK